MEKLYAELIMCIIIRNTLVQILKDLKYKVRSTVCSEFFEFGLFIIVLSMSIIILQSACCFLCSVFHFQTGCRKYFLLDCPNFRENADST